LNDRELLESAARAVGYDTSHSANAERLTLDPPVASLWIRDERGLVMTAWNPLTDDGDAFRLGVNIGLIVNTPSPIGEYAIVKFYDIDVWERVSDCRYAATRRAIVRAAAEIGKKMDAQPESVG